MTEYELVSEIKNLCPNNQMRDIFFEEIACDDPEMYLRHRIKGTIEDLTREDSPDGQITIHLSVDGLKQKYIFTPI